MRARSGDRRARSRRAGRRQDSRRHGEVLRPLDRTSRRDGNQGKSLDDIKKELRMPETDDWQGKDRYPNNIAAAYRTVTGK